jgi:trans-aconitate 2-methyltransferase
VTTTWDPQQYLKFEAERARAFHDLIAQIADRSPRTVVDLGCGPGHLTVTLAERWPDAEVTGVDSSADMIAAAPPGPRLRFERVGIEDWRPPAPVDLIVSNAALQWVTSHVDLLPVWVHSALNPGGALAFQVPGAGGSAASVAIRQVAASPAWAGRLVTLAIRRGPTGGRSPVRTADEYVDILSRLGCRVNAWETTHLHVLQGDQPVLEWFAGTGLRPYLDALGDDHDAVAAFRADVADALAEAYPPAPYGTVLPFRRIFVVAEKP